MDGKEDAITALRAKIEAEGDAIRDLKAAKADKEAIQARVAVLLQLKADYKELAGEDYLPSKPAGSSDAKGKIEKKQINDDSSSSKKKKTKGSADATDSKAIAATELKGPVLYLKGGVGSPLDLKCALAAALCSTQQLSVSSATAAAMDSKVATHVPYYPALYDESSNLVIFGANAVCRFLAKDRIPTEVALQLLVEAVLDTEEQHLYPLLTKLPSEPAAQVMDAVERVEKRLSACSASAMSEEALSLLKCLVAPTLSSVMKMLPEESKQRFPIATAAVSWMLSSATHTIALQKLGDGEPGGGKGKKNKKQKDNNGNSSSGGFKNDDIVKPVLHDVEWGAMGLMSGLQLIFTAALKAAFPQLASTAENAELLDAVVMRCANQNFGDFQCNNAMAVGKALKGIAGYAGPIAPRDVAERILCAEPVNPIIASATCAPNGFINITLVSDALKNTIASIIQHGVRPPILPKKRVLVDFSSPNIAKEMHVGHLRSTIIGDAICRIFEFLNYDVLRVNHVGDWGTQFGMLITYLQEVYPDLLTNPPNISDLTAIYKKSKQRFDSDDQFKETARLNVVKLQAGDPTCRGIWQLLCNISRAEFQKVYDALDVRLEEVGESFYNPMIPDTIAALQAKGLVEEDEGMLVVRMPHFTIPLIVRKSDGGYGYDSTDMAALQYRTQTLQREWIVIITDAGQANHFYMCFDAAKAMGWLPETTHRADHIGFGVVQGDDGKRFKTRSSETVRLIDLLDAAKERMKDSLRQRAEEGKSSLKGDELEHAAQVIGYGAVKYFDLKQHPGTNYIFSYDRMLDTKGDTAVYLLFAFARLVSILRKAEEERKVDLASIEASASSIIDLSHPAERALAFELLQFGDMIQFVIRDLLPNRLCEYLKEIAVKFTDFVTKCHVLNAPDDRLMQSRLLLCQATKKVMHQCFSLLGIGTLDRI